MLADNMIEGAEVVEDKHVKVKCPWSILSENNKFSLMYHHNFSNAVVSGHYTNEFIVFDEDILKEFLEAIKDQMFFTISRVNEIETFNYCNDRVKFELNKDGEVALSNGKKTVTFSKLDLKTLLYQLIVHFRLGK